MTWKSPVHVSLTISGGTVFGNNGSSSPDSFSDSKARIANEKLEDIKLENTHQLFKVAS